MKRGKVEVISLSFPGARIYLVAGMKISRWQYLKPGPDGRAMRGAKKTAQFRALSGGRKGDMIKVEVV